ncbi:l-fucose permease [Diplodia corticola]|uniref:L-fucose permease n=1 Tax=Diplodia corticola TaxID=236234 RepID=A0A1J9QYC6_9PEZI|nr:l-fucose permease [Diplodia corticola]OJD33377.1 l-fucose permease [Diplodia corticola]
MALTDDLGPLSWIISVSFFAICAISFVLRLCARVFVARAFTWDDRLMAIAFVTLIAEMYICWEWLVLGGGKHVRLVSSENLRKIRLVRKSAAIAFLDSSLTRSAQYELIEQFCYLLVHLFLKLSFLLYFYRTLYTPRLSTVIRITAVIVAVQTVASWIFYALQCRPLGAYIDPEDYPDATCYPDGIAYYAPVAVNVATIVLIYILPIPTLTQRPHQDRQAITTPPPPRSNTAPTPSNYASDPERHPSETQPRPSSSSPSSSPRNSSNSNSNNSSTTGSTLALFLLAGAGVVVSGLRVVAQYQQAATTTSASYSHPSSNDRTYNLALLAMATAVEFAVYVLVGNAPAVRALLLSLLPLLRRRRGGGWGAGRRGGCGDGQEGDGDEDGLWGEEGGEGGGKITITSRVSISITEALRVRDGPAYYPRKYFKFARPGAQSPTPNFLKEV